MQSIILAIFKREFQSYFATPIAYVFLVAFLLLTGISTFYFGNFLARGQADLVPFFSFHPWIYVVFVPALSMRLWSEERKTGSIELLLTLPISTWQAICGKFFAAYAFIALALGLTFPIWLAVNYLGKPDNGVILASYFGSLLMAGGFLGIGSCVSSLTKNQVVAFIVAVFLCLLVNLLGFPVVIDQVRGWMPAQIIDVIRSFSFLTNFDTISRGIVDLRSIVFFGSLIFFTLFANMVVIENKKAD